MRAKNEKIGITAKAAGLPTHPSAVEDHRSVITLFNEWVVPMGILTYEPERIGLAAGLPFHASRPAAHTDYTYELIAKGLAHVGATLQDVLHQTSYMKPEMVMSGADISLRDHVIARRRAYDGQLPACNDFVVQDLYVTGSHAEIEVLAFSNGTPLTRIHEVPGILPARPGSEPHAVRADEWVFVSGQGPDEAAEIGNDPSWYRSEIERQTSSVLEKLGAALEAAGSDIHHVVHTMVTLMDMRDLYVVDEIWARTFGDASPARTTIPVLRLASPTWRVQIDAIARVKGAKAGKPKTVRVEGLSQPRNPYPDGVVAGGLLFTSGVMAADENGRTATSRPNEIYPDLLESSRLQSREIFARIGQICEAAGTTIDNTLRDRHWHPDGMHRQMFPYLAERARAITKPPVATGIEVGKPLPVPDCTIIVDAVVAVPA